MNNLSSHLIEIFYSFTRFFICIEMLNYFFVNKNNRKYQLLVSILICLPPTLLGYYNSYQIAFSNILILVSVIYITMITSAILANSNFIMRFIVVSLCTIVSIFIELLVIFAVSSFEKNYYFGCIVSEVGSYKRLIYVTIFIVIWIITFYIAKIILPRTKNVLNGLLRYKSLLFGIVLAGLLSIIFFQRVYLIMVTRDLIILWILFLIWCLLILAAFAFYIKYRKTQEKARLNEIKNNMLEKNYHSMQTLYEQNYSIYHDCQNHLTTIYRLLHNEQHKEALNYISTIIKPIEVVENKSNSHNKVLDITINYKVFEAMNKKIRVQLDIEKVYQLNIDDSDLCSIFSNLMDNAIEACMNVKGDRWIEVTIRRQNDLLIFYIKNSIETMPIIINDELITTKENKSIHGQGIKSIMASVNKYEGYFNYEIKESSFEVCITMNC